MRYLFLILTIAYAIFSFSNHSLAAPTPLPASPKEAPKNEAEAAKEQLKVMLVQLDKIKTPIERFNLGGWVVLRGQVEEVIKTIERNNGVGNEETSEAYKDLVSQIESSADYFRIVETDNTKAEIKAFRDLSDQIKAARKMGDAILSRYNLRMYTKIKSLIEQLKTMPINSNLRQGLDSLEPFVQAVFVQDNAQKGDSPLTWEAGQKAASAIRGLNYLFEEAALDSRMFITVSSIRGFVEQYAYRANMAAQQKVESGR